MKVIILRFRADDQNMKVFFLLQPNISFVGVICPRFVEYIHVHAWNYKVLYKIRDESDFSVI